MPLQEIELVITVPEPYGTSLAYRTRCRTTLGVLTQLLAQSREHVIIAAPFMQAGHGLSDGPLAIAFRSALRRGVQVDVVSSGLSLVTLDRDRLEQEAFGCLRFFRPAPNLLDDQRLGSHAKFCVADGESAYVGSANLTSPGLARQMEMGLLVHGQIARSIFDFWIQMIEIGFFVEIV